MRDKSRRKREMGGCEGNEVKEEGYRRQPVNEADRTGRKEPRRGPAGRGGPSLGGATACRYRSSAGG